MFTCAGLLALSMEIAKPQVVIVTSLGEITVELENQKAPATVNNFLTYVDMGHYRHAQFHRTVTLANQPNNLVKIEVIQGGVNPALAKFDRAPLALERTNKTGLSHRNGTISMARDGADTATSDFFICIGDQPELDFGGKRNPDGQGFAAFGQVKAGMDVVLKIQVQPESDQSLRPPVVISEIRRN